ncbi:hypothetical protein CYLTODRAFT_481926 [Cylindrobasidium torrendii FP15055 ss-10]|uniref:Uncharacterized protein n=1 Tax=Cylindrobasidium torrendii FP15055 ss-10 TaxID=1314674 RepID=A0A0D7ASU6_9AGAR|nr:hypothetical protein CYLTODRAFT_481926 [Cylindrobasidium torrendii FP15055 ss-10]
MARVVFLKRQILELYGRLMWLELRPLLYDPLAHPRETREVLMGAVVGKLEIAERFYRAGIPVWLVREDHLMKPNWRDDAVFLAGVRDQMPPFRRTFGVNVHASFPDPSRPILGHFAAGDVQRYGVAYEYLVSLCSSKGEPWAPRGMEFPREFAHAEYLASLQDDRVDELQRSAPPLSFALMDGIPEQFVDEEEGWGDAARDLPLGMDSWPAEDGPGMGTGSASTSTPRARPQPRTSYAPQGKFTREERKDGAADRNKFVESGVDCMPRMVKGWNEAGLRLSARYFARLAPKEGTGYALPVPEHLATIDQAFIRTYLIFHELLVLRLDLPLKYVPPLSAKEWRLVMGRGVLKKPSATNKRGLKKWEAGQAVLAEALRELPNIKNIDLNNVQKEHPTWQGRVVDSVTRRIRIELAWESCEVNFRYDLLALDKQRYSLAEESVFAFSATSGDGLSMTSEELTASTWEERQQRIFGLFPHWESSLAPRLSSQRVGFESQDLRVRVRTWLALWELMETWTLGRVPPEADTIVAVESMRMELMRGPGGSCIAFEFGRNFVEAFRRAPVVPHALPEVY